MAEHLIRVSLRWATFGYVVQAGRVVRVAPIAGWLRGKDAAWAARYWRQRGATVEVIGE